MSVVDKVFDIFGGQQAAHGGGFDEQEVEIVALKHSIRALEHTVRTMMIEMRAMQSELAALKQGGVVIAPVNVDAAPAAKAPVADAAPATAEAPEAAPVEAEAAAPAAAEPAAAEPVGLAAAARAAAEAGVKTSTTMRIDIADENASETPGFNGSNDPVIGSVVADGELRTADDGAAFWGPVDNESSRAKAAGLVLDIDRDECIGCGTCVEHEDTVYELIDDEGKAYILKQEGPMDNIQDAIDACPVTCINWVKPEDVFVD